MSHSSEEIVSVSDGDVTVEKTFAADEFPVPAIKFEISSTLDEEARIRVIDRIPESFPMESVGFHPDFESENWTAYKDHRVEFERTLDAGEDLVTVYGIRLTDDETPDSFLTEPTLERVPVDSGLDPDDIDDILGEDRSQLVRDVLAGNRDPIRADEDVDDADDDSIVAGPSDEELASAFGRDAEGAADADADPAELSPDAEILVDDDPTPREVNAETSPAVSKRPNDADDESVSDEVEVDDEPANEAEVDEEVEVDDESVDEEVEVDDESVDEEVEVDDESVDEADSDEQETEVDEHEAEDEYVDAEQALIDAAADEAADEPDESHEAEVGAPESDAVDDEPEPAAASVAAGGLAAALAAEIREGDVEDDDLSVLREVVATDAQRSTDVRITHLQSKLADLEAYSDALAEFIDEEGTGEELIEGFRSELADVQADIGALDGMVEDAVESVDDTASRLDSVEETLADVDARADRTEYRLTDLDEDFEEHADRLEDHDEMFDEFVERVDDHDERIEEATNHIQAGASRLDSVEETLSDHGSDLDTVHEQLDEFDARLGDVLERIDEVDSNASEANETAANLHAEIGEIREDIASLDGDVVEAREAIEADVDDLQGEIDDLSELQGEIDDLHDAVAELDTFRERLAGAFGTGMGSAPGDE